MSVPLIIATAQGNRSKQVPIWMMRQAGRHLPEYQEVRHAHTFFEMCETPAVATEVTLQPVRRYKTDAAILFSDILVIPKAMGMGVEFMESKGPCLQPRLSTQADIDRLALITPEKDLKFVAETIHLLKKELTVPLIGFSGAPFTLASYMVEGGHSANFTHLRRLMLVDPDTYHCLMAKLTEAVIAYYKMQVDRGVQLIQLFDTWAGILTPRDYESDVAPYNRQIMDHLAEYAPNLPKIYYTNNATHLLKEIATLNADVISLDWRIEIGKAIRTLRKYISHRPVVVQGNLDPTLLYAPIPIIQKRTIEILDQGRIADGHIFNLGHGVFPDVSVDRVQALVDTVHHYTG